MAATELTVQSSSVTGTVLTPQSVNTGDGVSFTNNERTRIIVSNASGGAVTFTAITTQVVESDLAVADRDYSIDDGTSEIIGPFLVSIYSGTVTLSSWSTATNVSLYVIST
jgi:hypothetical protein